MRASRLQIARMSQGRVQVLQSRFNDAALVFLIIGRRTAKLVIKNQFQTLNLTRIEKCLA